jgi:flavorubredoxin
VKTGDGIDLGNGKELVFAEIPNVHWPETMATFERSTGTLFSCDAFGSFGAIGDSPYDDQLDEGQLEFYEEETLRYYANIVARFSQPVLNALKKIETLELGVNIIAPGHGIVWRKEPERIVDLYWKYAMYSKCETEHFITLLWSSMYGNTEFAVQEAIKELENSGINFVVHKVPETHTSDVLASVWKSSGIILAMPTYEYGMFPPMANVIEELGKKMVKNRLAFRFGSYGWSGGAQRELDHILHNHRMNWDFLDPVEFKGRPREQDLEKIRERTGDMIRRIVD